MTDEPRTGDQSLPPRRQLRTEGAATARTVGISSRGSATDADPFALLITLPDVDEPPLTPIFAPPRSSSLTPRHGVQASTGSTAPATRAKHHARRRALRVTLFAAGSTVFAAVIVLAALAIVNSHPR